MPARCHQDSCSIAWSEVNTGSGPAYQADARIKPTLECSGDGLGVRLSGAAGQILSIQGDGLLASLPASFVKPFNDGSRTPLDYDAESGSPAETPQHFYTNTYGRPVLVIISAQLRIRGAVLGSGSGITDDDLIRTGKIETESPARSLFPFNASLDAVLAVDTSPAPTAEAVRSRFNITGMMPTFVGALSHQFIEDRRGVSHAVIVAPGDTVYARSLWSWNGKNQTMNFSAKGSGSGFENNGVYMTDGTFAVVPL
jgi:hypothetical protein